MRSFTRRSAELEEMDAPDVAEKGLIDCLNDPRMAGHRLSDFPHNAIHKGTLAAAPYAPSSGL